jgi:transposase
MEDGSKVHTARAVKEEWGWHGLHRIWFPANSPDLNPIENLWRKLKDAVARRRPQNQKELRQMLQEEWEKIDLDWIRALVYSMNDRCRAVIAAGGGPTKW